MTLFRELKHPGIVRGHAAFIDSQAVYLVAEFCGRGDLCDVARCFERNCIPEDAVSRKVCPRGRAKRLARSAGVSETFNVPTISRLQVLSL